MRIAHPHVLHDLLNIIEVAVLRGEEHGLPRSLYEILLLYQKLLVLDLFLFRLFLL